jgi:uncharacterized protein (DUF4415 family)
MAVISYTPDPKNPPRFTEEERRRLEAMTDADIDLSESPELTEEFFRNAVRGPVRIGPKEHVSIRLDSDVLAWLRSFGRGYQIRINRILRGVMESALLSEKAVAASASRPGGRVVKKARKASRAAMTVKKARGKR